MVFDFCQRVSLVPFLLLTTVHYCEDVGIETAESKAARDEFNVALEFLGTEKINEIYLLTIALSTVTEHATFIYGVKLGV